jgi:hypothetical protein
MKNSFLRFLFSFFLPFFFFGCAHVSEDHYDEAKVVVGKAEKSRLPPSSVLRQGKEPTNSPELTGPSGSRVLPDDLFVFGKSRLFPCCSVASDARDASEAQGMCPAASDDGFFQKPEPAPMPAFEAVASWYALEGLRTASGATRSRNDLAAAHKDLPFGTLLKVTNPSNGRDVVVEVDDRPGKGMIRLNRDLDLSYRAARALGMVRQGVKRVDVQIIALPGNGRA